MRYVESDHVSILVFGLVLLMDQIMGAVTTYEEWLTEVRDALTSMNMSIDDWQSIWRFDFGAEHDRGTEPDVTALKANRFWWYQQNKSLGRDCPPSANCWLTRGHQGSCEPV
jgi:hypothetical protein